MEKKKGISLIVLIITIIVIIILAGAVILNLSKNNPIESARKAKFLNDIDTFKSELSLYELNQMSGTDGNYNPKLLNADKSGSTENGDPINVDKKITDIIKSMVNTDYTDKLEVIVGELVYVGDNEKESNWSDGVIEVKDFKIDVAVVPDTTHLSGTITLSGMMVDPSKIEYYRVYLSQTSGEHGDIPAQEITEKNATVNFNITEGIVSNTEYYIIVELKMSNESDVRAKEVKVRTSIDDVTPNEPQISKPSYSKTLTITPMAITLTDNEGGSGINKTGSKYVIDIVSTNYSEDDNIWQTGATNLTAESFVGDVATLGMEVAGDGEYYVHVLSIDNAGNKKTATSGKVVVDTIVPNEAGITIPSSTITNSVDATVVLSDNEGGSSIELSECKYIYSTVSYPYGDTEAIWDTGTVFTSETQIITVTSSTNEVYYLHVLIVDKAGNRREVLSSGVAINTDIPVAPVVSGTVGTNVWTNQNVTLTVSEVASPGIIRYEYSINGGTWQTYNATNRIVVTSEGTTTIKARAINNIGTVGAESTGYIVKIDKTNPTVTFGTNGASNVEIANTTVTISDNASGINASTLQYVWSTNTTEPSSGWTAFNNGTTLSYSSDGTYYLWIKANDNVGNSISARTNAFAITTEYNATKGVNKPRLAVGMTPIKWDASGNVVATTESDPDWYDYTNSKWANAETADGSMWVWIPRYEYKIPTSHTSTSQIIQINFIANTQTMATSGYIMHPAFTFGSTEITGIWVAKFEATAREGIANSLSGDNVTTKHIKVLPSVNSWRNIHVSNIFAVCRNMENDSTYGWGTSGIGIDTHLIKNVEWGAVAYLTASRYGRNGQEVWINPSSNFITGQSGTSVDAATTTTTYPYNDTTYGVNASTTGNTYGIYDMSGGNAEYVAAYVNNGNPDLQNLGSNLVNASVQYKDVYISNGDTQSGNYAATSNRVGDAIYETSTAGTDATSWNGDFSMMPYGSNMFMLRGAVYWDNTQSGIFYFYCGSTNYGDIGFRPVIQVSSGL